MVKIFIGNIKEGSKSEDLKALFEKHGKVTESDILTNFGFVHMEKEEDAMKAVKALHETTFNGTIIRVEMSHGKKSDKGPYRGGYAPRGGMRGAYRGAYGPPYSEMYDPGYGYAEADYGTEEVYDGYGGELYYTGAAAGADLYGGDPYAAARPYDAYARRRPPVRMDPYASSLAERRAALARADPYRAAAAAAAVDPYYGGPAAAPRAPDMYQARPATDPYYGGAPRADPYGRVAPADHGDVYARAAEQPRVPVDLMDAALPRAAAPASDPFAVAPVDRDPYSRPALERQDPYAAAGARAAYDVADRAAQGAQPASMTSRVLDRPPPEYYRRAAALGGATGYDPLMDQRAAAG